jgi:ketosteroid isomerase-like protein
MKSPKTWSSVLLISIVAVINLGSAAQAEVKLLAYGGYSVETEVILPVSPNVAYDAATGDIGAWWDHSFSKSPKRLYIEAKPGGGFYEIFDDSGNGALHAVVNYAERGKLLRFTGPLGFSGNALDDVITYDFKPEGSGTRLHILVNMVGQISNEDAQAVDQVWHHFADRLKAYIESGDYLKKAVPVSAQSELLEQLTAQERKRWDARKAGSTAAFADLIAEDAVFVDSRGPESKAAVVQHASDSKLKDYFMDNVKLITFTATSGLIAYKMTEKTIAGKNKEVASDFFISVFWVQRDGKWLCVFSQESR